jgi:hypothetical protein
MLWNDIVAIIVVVEEIGKYHAVLAVQVHAMPPRHIGFDPQKKERAGNIAIPPCLTEPQFGIRIPSADKKVIARIHEVGVMQNDIHNPFRLDLDRSERVFTEELVPHPFDFR